jgi:DNA-binding transcriptional regulator GbsR (MarR family)
MIAPLPKDLAQIVEQLGLIFEGFGIPRMAGRIFGMMMTNDEEYATQAELADLLQASAGSISTMIRLLEQLGFVERVSIPGERRDRFRLSDDPLAKMTGRRIETMEKVLGLLADAQHSDEISPAATQRLARAEAFYHFWEEAMRDRLEEWYAREGGP